MLGPMVVAAAIIVSLAGAAQPLRRALALEPAVMLREGADRCSGNSHPARCNSANAGRLLLAFSALAVAATLATALFEHLFGYRTQNARRIPRIRREHRHRAARVAGKRFRSAAVEEAEHQGAVAAPFVYTVGRLNERASRRSRNRSSDAPLRSPITGESTGSAPPAKASAWPERVRRRISV